MSDRSDRYLSYLLRLWRTETGALGEWRASLQQPGSDEQHAFSSLEALFAYLDDRSRHPQDEDALPGNRRESSADDMTDTGSADR